MKRRNLLTLLPTAALALALSACGGDEGLPAGEDAGALVQVVEVWVDAGPAAGGAGTVRVASATLREDPARPGTYALATPLRQRLPSGMELEITGERAATGEFQIGISHNGELISSGKYTGPFTVRMYPPGATPYVVYIREDVAEDRQG